MDITKSVEPKSDQLNFDDVQVTPLTITVEAVKAGPPDQPVELRNPEYPGRPYKPGKSMRRVLIAAWGPEASAYVGRRITLYGDPSIKFGKDAVGGIRISHLSHIDGPLTVSLTVTRGKRAPFVVQPLPAEVSAADLGHALENATTLPELQAAWGRVIAAGQGGNPALVKAKDARKADLAPVSA